MARNYEDRTAWAVGLVLLSVVLALASRLVRSNAKFFWLIGRAYRVLLWLALGCFVAGVSLAMLTLNSSLGRDDRPSIATQATRDAAGQVTVTGTAKAGGLKATELVHVFLIAVKRDNASEQVYYSQVGPSQDGLVDHAFSVVLDPDIDSVVVTVSNTGSATCEPPELTSDPPALTPEEGSSDESEELIKPLDGTTACALVSIGRAPKPQVAESQKSPGRLQPDRERRPERRSQPE